MDSYYKNINHTAWRFLHQYNPWMIRESDNQTHFGRYKNTIGQLWLAANDASQPPLDGMSLEGRVNEFIARIADMGRSNNGLGSANMGDYPVCEQGMLGHLVLAVNSHPLYRVVSPADVAARFNEYIRDVIATKITSANRNHIADVYKKMVDFEDLTPAETASLVALNLSEAEVAIFKDRIKIAYGEAYTNSPAFARFLENALSLGIYNSQFEKYASVLNLDNVLHNPMVQTGPDTASAIDIKAAIHNMRGQDSVDSDEAPGVKNNM